MFSCIDLKGLRKSPMFGYAAELPFFKARRKVEFKPGLNILFGPNGCGKSTILKMLGETMCATQGGVSTITQTAVSNTVDVMTNAKDQIALTVVHDGQPVMFCDPRNVVGLRRGAFDDDFFSQGVHALTATRNRSHGEASASRLNAVLGVLEGSVQPPSEIHRAFGKKGVNDLWVKAIDVVEKRMAAQCEKGQASVLLDEPEANLSLQWQRNLWSLLSDPSVSDRAQVIIATHSPFALGIPHANYIDIVEGYRDDMQVLLMAHFAAIAARSA